MEENESSFLQELLAQTNEFFSNGWTSSNATTPTTTTTTSLDDCFDQYNQITSNYFIPNSSTSNSEELLFPPHLNLTNIDEEALFDPFVVADDPPPHLGLQEDFRPISNIDEDEDEKEGEKEEKVGPVNFPGDDHQIRNTEYSVFYHQIQVQSTKKDVIPIFRMGSNIERRKNVIMPKKKIVGQPSKNLMAERRRRKRLNDRLAMLRSIVPKISKMDRTAILGDAIDYTKELLEKVAKLQKEIDEMGTKDNDPFNTLSIFEDIEPNQLIVRNPPKFDVERRPNGETSIEILCNVKPGLLLSTVNGLEELGLEIQQCVISCFSNDFSMRASCNSHEDMKKQGMVAGGEDIKEALFRSAGYGGMF